MYLNYNVFISILIRNIKVVITGENGDTFRVRVF